MLRRRNFLPHAGADVVCFLLLFTFIPITFVFELTIVLPEFHDMDSFFYMFSWTVGVFLLFNVLGNMIACMLVDTSIKTTLLQPPNDADTRKLWHFCYSCEVMAPPRSWHCTTCRTCILKRDHHCLFTGCCIGHHNHRYFLLFMLYICLGSACTTAYNSVYVWWLHADTFANLTTGLKMVFPMLMFTLDTSWNNFYLLIYELNIVAFAYSLMLICFHIPLLLRGTVAYNRHSCKYDLGCKRNLQMVLGFRMHLVWLSPFIKSELPHDGVHWEIVLQQSAKNR